MSRFWNTRLWINLSNFRNRFSVKQTKYGKRKMLYLSQFPILCNLFWASWTLKWVLHYVKILWFASYCVFRFLVLYLRPSNSACRRTGFSIHHYIVILIFRFLKWINANRNLSLGPPPPPNTKKKPKMCHRLPIILYYNNIYYHYHSLNSVPVIVFTVDYSLI